MASMPGRLQCRGFLGSSGCCRLMHQAVRRAPALDEQGPLRLQQLQSRSHNRRLQLIRGADNQNTERQCRACRAAAAWRMDSPRPRAELPPGEPQTKDEQHRCDQSRHGPEAARVLSVPKADPKRGLTLRSAARRLQQPATQPHDELMTCRKVIGYIAATGTSMAKTATGSFNEQNA